jgi:hypothetical protein
LIEVVTEHFIEGARERGFPGQPFIDQDAEGILITGGAGVLLDLFGSHVQWGACGWIAQRERIQSAFHHGQAKITEHHLVVGVE